MNGRSRFEREMEALQIVQPEFDSPLGTARLILELDEVKIGEAAAPFALKSGMFKAFFCRPLSSPTIVFALKGHVTVEDGGKRRSFQKSDHTTWPRLAAATLVYPTGGVKAAAAGVRRIRDDGTFTAMTSATLDGGTWRIRIRVNLEWTGGNKISVEGAIDYSPLECFLAVTDRHEQARPTSQSHFEFLSSVRKMFQPAKGSPLEPLFPLLLDRTKNVPRLAGLDTADGKNVRRFETIEIQGVPADMGHVLIGIEASRRQQPALHGFGLPIVWAGDDIEVSLTWIGDLGGVLAWVAQETPLAGSGPKPDLQRLLPLKASYEDLRGDLDGINLGTMYDETRSLAANLRSYYDATPFRRFRTFVVNARNAAGTPVFRLTGGNPPKIDRSARAAVAWYLQLFVHRFLIFPMNKRYAGMTDPQKIAALDIGRAGSVQSNAVIDYFFQFLDDGLAKEP